MLHGVHVRMTEHHIDVAPVAGTGAGGTSKWGWQRWFRVRRPRFSFPRGHLLLSPCPLLHTGRRQWLAAAMTMVGFIDGELGKCMSGEGWPQRRGRLWSWYSALGAANQVWRGGLRLSPARPRTKTNLIGSRHQNRHLTSSCPPGIRSPSASFGGRASLISSIASHLCRQALVRSCSRASRDAALLLAGWHFFVIHQLGAEACSERKPVDRFLPIPARPSIGEPIFQPLSGAIRPCAG
ncbi:unnamed protein product [Periconia digitata]|uniref:Uncharacterized protein n=1 Tax=Periconia digitata TaxID=1303443 RepID=A0A9W4UG38_9PLEO|nr:unnamed protein product [Periconia digitata]